MMKTPLLDGIRKEAADPSMFRQFLKSEGIKSLLTSKPVILSSLIGAGVGAGSGALVDKNNRLRGALIGAGAGGLLGGGVGTYRLSRLLNKKIPGRIINMAQERIDYRDAWKKTRELEKQKDILRNAGNPKFVDIDDKIPLFKDHIRTNTNDLPSSVSRFVWKKLKGMGVGAGDSLIPR